MATGAELERRTEESERGALAAEADSAEPDGPLTTQAELGTKRANDSEASPEMDPTDRDLAAPSSRPTRRELRLGCLILGVLVVVGLPLFSILRYPSDSYPFRASSAHAGYQTEGRIGRVYAFGLVVHTKHQMQPWLEIDLEEVRTIERISVKQRTDCCKERGLPLYIEIAGEDRAWRRVGEKHQPFDTFTASFPAQQARWVRIRSFANTSLTFRQIRIK